LGSFSRNLRHELKQSRKIYFYDNGVRNAVIGDFTIAEKRRDIGQLWENFLVSERYKHNEYTGSYSRRYFWRTTDQKEIDYLEEADGKLSAYEFKWNAKAKYKKPAVFFETYPDTNFTLVTPDNYDDFIM
jgi:predicted AAA+ superfamily ATPase